MGRDSSIRIHEVAFCGDVKSWADDLFSRHGEWPFVKAAIEEFGRGNNKRQDLRIFDRKHQTPILCGEVKMPGTPEGRSPYDPALMQDAFNKADNAQCPYFFTWNVNTFVLFDRSKWQVPMIERRVREWDLGLRLTTPVECKHPEVQASIRDKFLPAFFKEFSAIVEGKVREWGMPPDEIFIRSLESHLDWPVIGTRDYLGMQCQKDKAFKARFQSWMAEEMQWTFDPSNIEDWRASLERAARTLCYVFCNRAIFYEAIRARYPEALPELAMPKGKRSSEQLYDHFRGRFSQAIVETGDYEPIFYPHVNDWAGALVFASSFAQQGWTGVFANLGQYNFREIPHDIVGGIFQKLIAPEERQKFGQYFTNQDIVDVINAFCIRRAGDTVLDPACGSGSFLVRAYHRKAWLSEQASGGRRHADHQKHHQELISELFGCDIALFAAHLATLNLAARRITDEENYPYIARGNFFEVAETKDVFCRVPGRRLDSEGGVTREIRAIVLPELDAVVGNPPYVRQELISRSREMKRAKGEDRVSYESRIKNSKEHMQHMCSLAWPDLTLGGRSDLHCYFWPVAAKMLKEGAYFGFLTSSSWLDVEYGFPLQKWILQNFKIIAVIESMDEPWFEDARIKTAITILQRCNDMQARDINVVKFVRLGKPVKEILGERAMGDETARQTAAEALRKFIEKTKAFHEDDNLRIIPVVQKQLWDEGVKAGLLLGKGVPEDLSTEETEDEEDAENTNQISMGDYVAGKWGRFLRAPDLYFRLIEKYGNRFVKLGEIAKVRRGITSGCDAFFMPHDVTEEVLKEHAKGLPWNDVGLMKPCKFSEVESGKVKIVRAGDNTLHPIESEFLKPEVHSLMQVSRPAVRENDTDRVVLWTNSPLEDLEGTYVAKYIKWGAKHTFESKKSKAVPVPERTSCASRPLWYDLTNVTTGAAFWPMAQKYRHIVPTNPDSLVCNHNLFYLLPQNLNAAGIIALNASLNSTLVALFKHFYGRYAGAEGTLKTEVIDSVLLDIPDPRAVSMKLAERMKKALERICSRDVTHMVDAAMLNCHDEAHMRELLTRPPELPQELQQPDRITLDDAVLELLGIENERERKSLREELYNVTVQYYRYQRTQDIQAMENRAAAGGGRRFTAQDLAAGIWDSLSEAEKSPPIEAWLKTLPDAVDICDIPDGKAKAHGADHLFDPTAVVFASGKDRKEVAYHNVEQAELVAILANLEIRGKVKLPHDPKNCAHWIEQLQKRLHSAHSTFENIAASRTGTARLQEQTTDMLMQWFIHGRPESGG
jgi:hypothetical protein